MLSWDSPIGYVIGRQSVELAHRFFAFHVADIKGYSLFTVRLNVTFTTS